jgi:hypothetical protein
MTPPKKPEWFELTEGDAGKPRTSVKRSARGVLLALPLLLIGVGVVVAQGTDESPAAAESSTTLSSATPQFNTLPAIATPPTAGDYEDGDDDYEDDEEEEEDDDDENEEEEDDD